MDYRVLNMMSYKIIIQVITMITVALVSATTYACTQAQIVDFDYKIKATLGDGYSTFGRLWLLDGQEACTKSLKYGACFTIVPDGRAGKLTVVITKSEGNAEVYNQSIQYNSSEVIRFDGIGMEVYLKLFVSNTVADLKMSGKACQSGFPTLPRQVTREELDNMFSG